MRSTTYYICFYPDDDSEEVGTLYLTSESEWEGEPLDDSIYEELGRWEGYDEEWNEAVDRAKEITGLRIWRQITPETDGYGGWVMAYGIAGR